MDIAKSIIISRLSDSQDNTERRRCILALGEIGGSDVVASLTHLLASDYDPGVRLNCAKVLGDLMAMESIIALQHAVFNDVDPQVREIAAITLGKLNDPTSIPVLAQLLLLDADADVRERCVEALSLLAQYSPKEIVVLLTKVLDVELDFGVRLYIAKAISRISNLDVALPN